MSIDSTKDRFEEWTREVEDFVFDTAPAWEGRANFNYSDMATEGAWRGWQERGREVQALKDKNRALHRTLSFFVSSIKCGEQWSAYHEEELDVIRRATEGVADVQ